ARAGARRARQLRGDAHRLLRARVGGRAQSHHRGEPRQRRGIEHRAEAAAIGSRPFALGSRSRQGRRAARAVGLFRRGRADPRVRRMVDLQPAGDGVSVELLRPHALWILCALPLVGAALWASLVDLPRWQQWLSALLRVSLLALLALALARPSTVG